VGLYKNVDIHPSVTVTVTKVFILRFLLKDRRVCLRNNTIYGRNYNAMLMQSHTLHSQ